MSLQSKLFLFFIGIVVVPLTVAALLTQRAVSDALQREDSARVGLAAPGAVALYISRVGAIDDRVVNIGADADLKRYVVRGERANIESSLRKALDVKPGLLDFAVVLDPFGGIIAEVPGQPVYLPGVAAPTVDQMLVTQTATGEPTMSSLLAAYTIVPLVNGSRSRP